MATQKGTVATISEREWNGREGPVILHSFQLQGTQGWFRTGTNKLVSKGQNVSFDADERGNVAPESLQVFEAAVQQAPAVQGASQQRRTWGGGKANEKDDYWRAKEERDLKREARNETVVEPRITFSSAQRDAIEIVGIALRHDLLSFGNASKGAKLGLLLNYVDEVTARFYKQRIDAAGAIDGMDKKEAAAAKSEEPSYDD